MISGDHLATRLKNETKTLHDAVERELGLPGSIRTREEYVAFLVRLLRFHQTFEENIESVKWSSDWINVEIATAEHVRSDLIQDDLVNLGVEIDSRKVNIFEYETFAQVLGGLYVVEGSSLGGRVIAPTLKRLLENIPTRFFESDGRSHPQPWRSVKSALMRAELIGLNSDEIIRGAAMTFENFGKYLTASQWQLS